MVYKTRPMKIVGIVAVVFAAAFAGAQTSAAPAGAVTVAARTAGLQRHEGFLPYYWDEKKGGILFELSPTALDREFLYFTGHGHGDRVDASVRGSQFVWEFGVVPFPAGWWARAGDPGEHWLSRREGSAELKHSVESSFPLRCWRRFRSKPSRMALCWWMPVRCSCEMLRICCHSCGGRPARSEARWCGMKSPQGRIGGWIKDRSLIDPDHSGSFPLNTEVEALLTFATDSESDLNQPDPHTLERARAPLVCGLARAGI